MNKTQTKAKQQIFYQNKKKQRKQKEKNAKT